MKPPEWGGVAGDCPGSGIACGQPKARTPRGAVARARSSRLSEHRRLRLTSRPPARLACGPRAHSDPSPDSAKCCRARPTDSCGTWRRPAPSRCHALFLHHAPPGSSHRPAPMTPPTRRSAPSGAPPSYRPAHPAGARGERPVSEARVSPTGHVTFPALTPPRYRVARSSEPPAQCSAQAQILLRGG